MRRFILASVLILTGATACTNNETAPPDVTAVETPSVGGSINWEMCEDSEILKCARFDVPYDYDNPEVGTFSLKVVMRPANNQKKRVGYMLVNPGGPGFGGTYLAEGAESFFGGDLIESFDIVGWDPRGTGESTPAIDCVDDYDPYFTYDPSPDDDAERQVIVDASQKFVDECVKKNSEILPYVSTNNSARDMDRLRAALGVEQKALRPS